VKSYDLLDDPLTLAILFHHTYERLAPPGSGDETPQEIRIDRRWRHHIFDPESANGKLMIAVCAEIQRAMNADLGRKLT